MCSKYVLEIEVNLSLNVLTKKTLAKKKKTLYVASKRVGGLPTNFLSSTNEFVGDVIPPTLPCTFLTAVSEENGQEQGFLLSVTLFNFVSVKKYVRSNELLSISLLFQQALRACGHEIELNV